jgi:hypothetical protein
MKLKSKDEESKATILAETIKNDGELNKKILD